MIYLAPTLLARMASPNGDSGPLAPLSFREPLPLFVALRGHAALPGERLTRRSAAGLRWASPGCSC